MDILRLGYIRFTGPITTQYVLGSRETDKHKAIADYFGFFGFDFDPLIPEEIQDKLYIEIPINSSTEETQNHAEEVLNLIATDYVVDPGCLYSLHKAFDTIPSLKHYRWQQPQFYNIKHFNFITGYGFDLDGSMFLYIIFDNLYERLSESLDIKRTDTGSLAKLLNFYAPTPPGGQTIFHIDAFMSALVEGHPVTTNMRRYPRVGDKFNSNIHKYLFESDVDRPSMLYLDSLIEQIESLYQ